MKKVYIVSRKSKVDYDEYDSCVIIADNIEEIHNVIDNSSDYRDCGRDDRKIEEIDLSSEESMVILSSYNAG